MPRKAIGKKLRFEVFKRDSFTCQYCGAKAPDVLLQVDHIEPVASGWEGTLLNLATSCQPCNAGKGKRRISDGSVVEKQRGQLAALQERNEQITMMLQWQRGLMGIEDSELQQVAAFWRDLAYGFELNEYGLRSLKKWLREFGVAEVLDAMQKSLLSYAEYDENDLPVDASLEKSFTYVGRVAKMVRVHESKPYLKDLFYIRGILRKRLRYLADRPALQLLESSYLGGVSIEDLKLAALECRSWTNFQTITDQLMEDASARTA